MTQSELPLTAPGLARKSDPDTSHTAADRIAPHISKLKERVLAEFKERGPMTAETCERLDCFSRFKNSTVKKRVSELASMGFLIDCGRDHQARMTIYGLRERSRIGRGDE